MTATPSSASPPTPAPPRRRHPWDVQREVLFALLLRELTARVGGQWVGAVWTLFEPLAHTLLLVAVLGSISTAVLPSIEFPVFLVIALVPFFLFQNLGMRLMDGIEANRGLFAYRQVKPLDTLISRTLVEALMSLVVYVLSLGLLGWLGYHVVPAQPLELILLNLLVIAFGFGFGLCLAVLGHGRQRFKSLMRMLMLPLYFASGVVFKVDLLPPEYFALLLWNPLLHLVELIRHAFIPAYELGHGVNVTYPGLFALATIALGLLLYRAERLRLMASS